MLFFTVTAYAKIQPAVNQVEMHPLLRQDALLAYCSANHIHVTAYSPLAANDSDPARGLTGTRLLEHAVVQKIAAETGKSAGQVLLRWGLQHGSSVIPKSVTPSRILENLQVQDWALSAEQYGQLSSLEPQVRVVQGAFMVSANGPYKSTAQLWDEEE